MVSGDRSTSPPLLISSSEWDKFLVFGDGCMHTRLTFNLKTAGGVRNFRSYMEEATDLVVSYGGSLSGEHGDGQAKGELLPKMFGSDLMQAFREFKSIWDLHWRMNPGKVVGAYRWIRICALVRIIALSQSSRTQISRRSRQLRRSHRAVLWSREVPISRQRQDVS